PSFTLRYGRQVEWTGGVVSDWSRGVQQRWYPFTTAMIAPWNTAKDSSDWDLRFFGSYAAANVYNVGNILLQDGDHPPIEVANPVTGPNFPVLTVAGGYKGNFAAQAGLRNTWFHGRLGWDYQWDHRKIKALEFGPPAPGFPTVGYRADLHIIRHRIGLNAKLIDRKEVVLESGLYTLMQRTRIVAGGTLPGSSTNPKNAWTGGWTNRILAGPFSAGINVLYNWNRPTVSLPAGNPETKKELLLHSAYVAYALKFRKQQAECYLSTRNPASGRYFQWQEGKRYFAAGVSVQL
ncbi:MAG TPA: hypothetical protein VHK69_02325, partial [Chitinophagaceae bacterium]|nr:hypothetical protein [Chitinophagaceae bacterium]